MRSKVRRRLASLTLLDLAAGAAISVALPAAVAQAQPSPATNWSGFYAGAHVGYRWADADFSNLSRTFNTPLSDDEFLTVPGFNSKLNPNGGIGGAHLGYNIQFNPTWLFGIEGDWSWGRSKASAVQGVSGVDDDNDAFTFRRQAEAILTWQATLRARTGIVIDRALWYVTGGVAYARFKWSDSALLLGDEAGEVSSGVAALQKNVTGYVLGAGYEQMLAPNFTVRAEYLYENFGDHTVPLALGGVGNVDLVVHKVRVGFSFKTP